MLSGGMPAETRIAAFCTQCRSRCGCTAVVAAGRLLRIEPLPAHPSGAALCPKGLAAPELVHHPDRLTRPLRRTAPKGAADPGWQAISWAQALDEVAGHMGRIRDDHGAEQVAFSVTTPSGTHISDSIAWVERLIRAFGSPNTIYATEICNWHKDYASRFTYGSDIGTPDIAQTDCVLLWGNNPAATHLSRAVEIRKARRRGAKLIVVDPRPTPFARQADVWLRVRPGTDQALALGLANLLLEAGGFDGDFARDWTNAPFLVREDNGLFLRQADLFAGGDPGILLAAGAEGEALLRYDSRAGRWLDNPAGAALRAWRRVRRGEAEISCRSALDLFAAAAASFPPARVVEATGVPEESLRQAASLIAASPTLAYYAWSGVGQSATATQTDRAIAILYALTGCYGARGGNVPGAAAPFADISGQELLGEAQRAKALGLAERPLGPARAGWVTARDVYRAVLGQGPYPVRMLVSFGGNLLASQPDPDLADRALRALDFHVHADLFLNPAAAYADIVLPVASSWEREGLRAGFDASLDGLRHVQLRPAAVAPVGEARGDTEIALALAERLGMAERMFGGEAERGHDHMLAPAGLDTAALRRQPEGLKVAGRVPYAAHAEPGEDGAPRGFPTPTRRIEIYSELLLRHGQPPLPAVRPGDLPERAPADPRFPVRLGNAKTLVFCHSQHRNIPALRRLMPDPLLEMAADVAGPRGIAEGDWVRVATATGGFVARARIVAEAAPGAVFAQHGWWVDGPPGSPYAADRPMAANMNAAIDTARADPVSGSIPLRASWCEVERIAGA